MSRPHPAVPFCARCGVDGMVVSDGRHQCHSTVWQPIKSCPCGASYLYAVTWPGGEWVEYMACERCAGRYPTRKATDPPPEAGAT
jgi:hypothetical protein